jgi:hypothetical protein
MPWVVFEPTIPAFERAKTVYALDRAATVIGFPVSLRSENLYVAIICKYSEYGINLLRCKVGKRKRSEPVSLPNASP